MYKEIKDFLNSNKEKYRGWRILIDHSGNSSIYYLSKFDDDYNEDEYRFFLREDNNLLKITRSFKIKSYDEPKDLLNKHKNKNYAVAEQIISEINQILTFA